MRVRKIPEGTRVRVYWEDIVETRSGTDRCPTDMWTEGRFAGTGKSDKTGNYYLNISHTRSISEGVWYGGWGIPWKLVTRLIVFPDDGEKEIECGDKRFHRVGDGVGGDLHASVGGDGELRGDVYGPEEVVGAGTGA